jgi:hypothetical protein
MIIVIAVIIGSIAIGNYYYYENQPELKISKTGQPVMVGSVLYDIEYIGNHNGNEDKRPENTYFEIRISAEQKGTEPTRISGGQFYLLDENDVKVQPDYGEFTEEDLLQAKLEPNKPISRTTQFDIVFDDNAKYRIGILATKDQQSRDIGIICVKNC